MDIEINKFWVGRQQDILANHYPDNCCDSIVTDFPYGLKFMGHSWDIKVPSVEDLKELFRVLKPGGYLLGFAATKTYHKTATNLEDAGFEIRDMILWLYGEGFPKSMDISKAFDKDAEAEREVVGVGTVTGKRIPNTGMDDGLGEGRIFSNSEPVQNLITKPQCDEAIEWDGFGTALKPACEPICMARKPLEAKTVIANIRIYRTGGINIKASRIPYKNQVDYKSAIWGRGTDITGGNFKGAQLSTGETDIEGDVSGRWPANVIMDEEAGCILDAQSGLLKTGKITAVNSPKKNNVFGKFNQANVNDFPASIGGASRFFYCPKPDNYEKEKGLLKDFDLKKAGIKNNSGRGYSETDPYKEILRRNDHPTIKPIALMRYLVKLVTPKGGVCLDPYVGSGTTAIGCKLELINFIAIDKDGHSIDIAEARTAAWNPDKYKPQTLFNLD